MATKRTVKQPLDCHERALRLLAVRPRARRELESRLRQAGFETAEVSVGARPTRGGRAARRRGLRARARRAPPDGPRERAPGRGRRARGQGRSSETIDADPGRPGAATRACGRSRWPRIGLAGSRACGPRWPTGGWSPSSRRRGYDGGTSPRGRQGGPGARRPARLSARSAPTRGHPCLCRADAVRSVRTRFIRWSTFNRA